MSKNVKKKKKLTRPYPFDFRLQVVKMFLEEKYPVNMICQETGVGKSTINKWVKLYRESGEDGLKSKFGNRNKKPQVKKAVKDKIVDLKKDNPTYGSRRITDILKRFFCIKTSPKTVHKTLSEEKLVEKKKVKPKKNPPKPRFFERSSPNQLWQSDICTFRLAGKNAYLIGFIDDYSRYIVGLGLYRSQTASNVLEIYRRAVGEYNVPKEILTDNGRQYVNWRGTTNFQKELQKDRVKHIRSRPHHPMTLGKIERFWKSILQEFLLRCQFDSFENAQERIAVWINYYNHRRPHQGIKGLCPADRYFEIQNELKQTLAKGIEENALELALRGKPKDPFYMVGRMNGQNVVIRAEKGKVRMLVNESEGPQSKELVYNMNMEEDSNAKENKNPKELYCSGENQGGSHGLDSVQEWNGNLQRAEPQLGIAGSLAKSGNGWNVESTGAEEEGGILSAKQSIGEALGEETFCAEWWLEDLGKPAGDSSEKEARCENLIRNNPDVSEKAEETKGDSKETGGDHYEGPFRLSYSYSGCSYARGVPQDLLQMGESSLAGNALGAGGEASRASGNTEPHKDRGRTENQNGKAGKRKGAA